MNCQGCGGAATVTSSEVMLRHFPGRTLENHEKYRRTAGTRDEIPIRDIQN